MIQQSVPQELEKQKVKLAMDQEENKINANKVKSLMKRKSKFTNQALEKMIRKGRSSCLIILVRMRKNSYKKWPSPPQGRKQRIFQKRGWQKKKAKHGNLDDN